MNTKTKITEIKETHIINTRVKGTIGEVQFEEKSFTRYKDVTYVDGFARFGHYVLDTIFYYIFIVVIAFVSGAFSVLIGMEGLFENPSVDVFFNILNYVILYPGYYLIFEYGLQSSPAKLMLGRVVVNEYGEKPTFKQILGRSYSRIVPFESLSCLSELGWHDKWSDTFVIRKKDLLELQLAIKAQEFGTNTEV
jgi:uncharacterized RDD family membrane protein YckC